MKKDNFDLRSYLIENKMTENSRGDVRHQLGETILDTRILSEMQIPADPSDHHDPDYDEDWASKQDAPDDIFAEEQEDATCPVEQFLDNWVDIVAFGADAEDYPEEGETFTATVAGHKIVEKYTAAGEQRGYGEITIDGKPLESFDENDPMFTELADALWSGDTTYADAAKAANVQRQRGVDECDLGGDMPLEETGYTDDDDDNWQDDNLDLDDRGGASLLDLVKGDKKAGRARKAAAVDTAADPAMDDEPVDTDTPDIDDPDAENAAGTSDPNAEAQPGLSAQVKYNPNTVEMMMDDQELDQYLSGFRRPQVAVNVLNRAIRTAQDEVNDSIGLNHLYIVLENGFYVTSRTERGQVIAKVTADQEWRKKNFGED